MDRSLSALLVATGVLTAAAVMHLSDDLPAILKPPGTSQEAGDASGVLGGWASEWKGLRAPAAPVTPRPPSRSQE